MKSRIFNLILFAFIFNINALQAQTEEATGASAEELAKQLANPVASLVSTIFKTVL